MEVWQADGLRDVLHRHRSERLPGTEIRQLPLQNFLTAAQERLLPLPDAADKPFRLRDLFDDILPRLRIVRLADEGAVEAADGQLRRVGPVDGDAEHAVFFLQEHVGDDIARRPARG